MPGDDDNKNDLRADNDELRRRLSESEETLRAIRSGEVDALLVNGPGGSQVYTLTGAESPYRVLVEQMQEGALSLTADGLILYCNRRFADLVRTPLERVIGREFREFINPPDRIRYSALVQNRITHNPSAELFLRCSEGTLVPVYLNVSRYDIEDGEGICVTTTDLTEQKRNEEMVASEKLARSILDQATEAIVVIDTQGKIVRANKSAHDLAGRNILLQSFEEAFQLEPEPVDENDSQRSVQSILAAALSGETIPLLAFRLSNPVDEVFQILVGMGPLKGPAGELVGSVVAFTNVTALKAAEEGVRRSNEELRRAYADLEQFAYSASHDLQQPIRNVAIYTQLLENRCRSLLDDEGLLHLSFIQAGALQMEKLVRDLLAYSQLTSETEPSIWESDANKALQAALRILAPAIRENRASISGDLLPIVRIRDVHLQQLFQNLAGNAIKYRSAQDPVVRIGARKDGDMYVFSVQDNGIGIAPEYHQQIFGIFKRLHSEDKYAGTGIGLAICQRIVGRYGGRIWVESTPGRGATFFFTVPG